MVALHICTPRPPRGWGCTVRIRGTWTGQTEDQDTYLALMAMYSYNLHPAEPEEDWPPRRAWFLSRFLPWFLSFYGAFPNHHASTSALLAVLGWVSVSHIVTLLMWKGFINTFDWNLTWCLQNDEVKTGFYNFTFIEHEIQISNLHKYSHLC